MTLEAFARVLYEAYRDAATAVPGSKPKGWDDLDAGERARWVDVARTADAVHGAGQRGMARGPGAPGQPHGGGIPFVPPDPNRPR
jgi:hypothetical protein